MRLVPRSALVDMECVSSFDRSQILAAHCHAAGRLSKPNRQPVEQADCGTGATCAGERRRRPAGLLTASAPLLYGGAASPPQRAGGPIRPRSRPAAPCRTQPPSPLSAARSRALSGRVRVPGDKSISHRALMFGALATGRTRIAGLLEGEDVLNTAKALQALGCPVAKIGAIWEVLGRGVGGLAEPAGDIDFGNSGTGMRLMMGVIAGHDMRGQVRSGDASLSRRPMGRVLKPLMQMGLEVEERRQGDAAADAARHAPICCRSNTPAGAVGADQVGRAARRAACAGRHDGRSRRKPPATTPSACCAISAREVTVAERRRIAAPSPLHGDAELEGRGVNVPGDPSSAAFLVGGRADRAGLGDHHRGRAGQPDAHGLLRHARGDGRRRRLPQRARGGRRAGGRHRACGTPGCKGVRVPPERAPSMIDEYPVLACLAAFAEGETRMEGLAELKVKESDRLAATAAGLAANGVPAKVEGDSLDRQRRRKERARRRDGRHPSRPPHRHGLPDAGPRRRPARHRRRRRHHRHQLPRVPRADGAAGRDLRSAGGVR